MKSFTWIFSILALILLLVANLKMGEFQLSWSDFFQLITLNSPSPEAHTIFWQFRVPKTLTCILAGAALAVAGLQMQTLFRNAMAGPDVLGLTSGASLTVSLFLLSPLALILHPQVAQWSLALVAGIGSSTVFLLMLALSNRLQHAISLLITGIMLSALTSSLVSVLQFFTGMEALRLYISWTFGNLDGLAYSELLVLTIVLIAGMGLAVGSSKSLNAWLLGNLYARSIGIRPGKTRWLTLTSAGILTGTVTAFCGPLAFVGLAVPHLVKLILKTHKHEILFPASVLGGAAFLLCCDLLTQLPGNGQVLPINSVTALFGAPIVVFVILRNRNWIQE